MADATLPFHERLRAAIEANGQDGQSFAAKVDGLHRHMRQRGIRGTHATVRTIRRWIAGHGFPPDRWCVMAAEYLGVTPSCIAPTAVERQGEAAKSRGRAPSRRVALPEPARVEVPEERWAEETIYIVGGGPSAGRHDLTRLHEQGVVIAVNDSATGLPEADVIFTASPPWVEHRARLIHGHRGQLVIRTACSDRHVRRWNLPPSAVVLPLRSVPGLGEEERSAGHNSGTEAIYWAAAQGARRIVLIGFDLDGPGHWHGGYEWFPDRETRRDAAEAYPLWATNMERVAQDLSAAGVQCWNANPLSAIRAFPFAELGAPMSRREDAPPEARRLSCAVVIPVGPGHEAFSRDAAASVVRAWEHDPGPFSSLQLAVVLDTDGRLGRSRARNQGLDSHPADWHFLLDADDEMMPRAFLLVDLEAPATFGAVLLDGQVSPDNVWPLCKSDLRDRGALGTLSMGCWVRGDLGLRFREGFPVGQDFDFYCRLPSFVKRREPLVNIGYRKPRAGHGEKDREAVGWLYVCNAIIEQHFGPSKGVKPVRLRRTTTQAEEATTGATP